MIYYNVKTKVWVTKIKRWYIEYQFNWNRCGIYVARHWSGTQRQPENTYYKIVLLWCHFKIGRIGPIIRDLNFPWKD